MTKIDQNYKSVGLAQKEGTSDVVDLRVDPSTGRLLIDIQLTTDPASSIANTSKIDANFKVTSLAYDGTNVKPLLIDNRNGYLSITT